MSGVRFPSPAPVPILDTLPHRLRSGAISGSDSILCAIVKQCASGWLSRDGTLRMHVLAAEAP